MNNAHRSLYIYLCGIMGLLLVVTLQRSLVYGYMMLEVIYPSIFNLGMSPNFFAVFDLLTLCLAMMAGGWYGVWLGLYWYDYVYGEKKAQGVALKLLEVFSLKNLKVSNTSYKADGFFAVAAPAKAARSTVRRKRPVSKRSVVKISV